MCYLRIVNLNSAPAQEDWVTWKSLYVRYSHTGYAHIKYSITWTDKIKHSYFSSQPYLLYCCGLLPHARPAVVHTVWWTSFMDMINTISPCTVPTDHIYLTGIDGGHQYIPIKYFHRTYGIYMSEFRIWITNSLFRECWSDICFWRLINFCFVKV